MNTPILIIYTDGGARGNPGPAAIGAVLYAQEEGAEPRQINTISQYIGEHTNNYAEYLALIRALQAAQSYHYQDISCFLDSELVVKQLNGLYKVKEPTLRPLVDQVMAIKNHFQSVTFTHVRRAQNALADKLVNEALDAQARTSSNS